MEDKLVMERELPEIRPAKKEDVKQLKEIWKLCFGDEDSFIDLYFNNRDWVNETVVLLQWGQPVSMLTLIPAVLTGADGSRCSASMIYAVATHPDYQKCGFADRLIEFGNRCLSEKHTLVTLLVPAGEALFRYYEKRGYSSGFYVREAVLSADGIDQLNAVSIPYCRIITAEPSDYNEVRRRLLKGHAFLDYRDEELSFQKKLARIFDSDLLMIDAGGWEGCAYYERISEEEVIIKELLIPDPYLAAALKSIAELIPAERYIVRTPADRGESLGGDVRPFGMLRLNGTDGECGTLEQTRQKDCYLGIAYD